MRRSILETERLAQITMADTHKRKYSLSSFCKQGRHSRCKGIMLISNRRKPLQRIKTICQCPCHSLVLDPDL